MYYSYFLILPLPPPPNLLSKKFIFSLSKLKNMCAKVYNLLLDSVNDIHVWGYSCSAPIENK